MSEKFICHVCVESLSTSSQSEKNPSLCNYCEEKFNKEDRREFSIRESEIIDFIQRESEEVSQFAEAEEAFFEAIGADCGGKN